jgi:iron(III) transport system ATP-binding protein
MSIEIENLSLNYGDVQAVKDASLHVSDGELIVLLGPSGCGKTSTMRSVVGLETPHSGRIVVKDRVVFDSKAGINVPAHRRNIAMVFQSYAIWPHKTVYGNVAFPLQVRGGGGRAAIRERVASALHLVGMSGYQDRPASRLSGGQMQRVALARSLVMNPDALLLDEPLSNLDARLRDNLRFELKELQVRVGLTGIYVTHDQAEALALGDRVAVMRGGQIIQIGPPDEVYERPVDSFVADFLGVTNIFSARLKSKSATDSHLLVGEQELGLRALTGQTQVDSGGSCLVGIRPESILVYPGGSRSVDQDFVRADSNCFRARLVIRSFLGTHYRLRLELEGGLTVDALTSDALRGCSTGSPVTLVIPHDKIHIFDK